MTLARCIVSGLPVVLLASFVAASGVSAGARSEQQEPKPKKTRGAPVADAEIVTREAVCRWAEQPPVLDGKLDDRCWQARR